MSYVCTKALRISGVDYAPGDAIPDGAIRPERVRALKTSGFIGELTEEVAPPADKKPEEKVVIEQVTIPVKGNIIRSEQTSNDMYVSIDLVEEVIERQLRKYKNKIADKQQEAGNFQKEYLEHDYLEDEDIQIIRTKKFGMKPMYPEDACVQMELLGHTFFVFRNAETDEVNVVYKRKNNTYGLIEPEC